MGANAKETVETVSSLRWQATLVDVFATAAMMRNSAIPEASSHGDNETQTAEESRDSASEGVVGNHSAIDEEGDEPEESNATHNA